MVYTAAMPELPEVESFRRALEKEYLGKIISEVHFRRDAIRYPLSPKIKEILCPGSRILRFERDGKQLIIETKYGAINISLGMSGSFLPTDPKHPHKHEHVTIVFKNKSAVGFVDPRRFGFWMVREKPLAHLADPLKSDELKKLFTTEKIKKSTRAIKDLLMDQKLIGGIGNIYALEALHLAGVSPKRRSNKVTRNEYRELSKMIPKILKKAIDAGGSTISTYRRLHGETGNFQEVHRVYGRENQSCPTKNCRGRIRKIRHGGRGSWYCPKCQH